MKTLNSVFPETVVHVKKKKKKKFGHYVDMRTRLTDSKKKKKTGGAERIPRSLSLR